MVWRAEDPQGEENAKVMWEIVRYTRGLVLDIGCGPHKTFPHFIGIDNRVDTRLFGIQMDPDLTVPDASELPLIASDSVDAVFSSHLLEHIEDHEKALREWWRVIKPGGYLILYLPDKDLYPNIGKEGANPDHKHDFERDDIIHAMHDIGHWTLLRNEQRSEDREYSFFQVFQKRTDGRHVFAEDQPKKLAVVVRYGAFGDAIQSAPIFAELKRQGYFVRAHVVNMSHEVLKHDPNIDEFVIQDRDQVPNAWLPWFFEYWEKHSAKFINLSGITEQTMLSQPTMPSWRWSHEARRALVGNVNYVEQMALTAGLKVRARDQRFWATLEERNWAHQQLDKITGTGKLICISMSGSAVHKAWPHIDIIIARILLEFPKWRIALLGGTYDQILETGWEKEERVWKLAGRISIREAMALAQVATVCMGAETGVMNAVAFEEKVAKILFMSHSSIANLPRDWLNTCAMVPPPTVHCYPCHMLHTGFDRCWRDDATGVAMCQAQISPDDVWQAFLVATGRQKRGGDGAEPERLLQRTG